MEILNQYQQNTDFGNSVIVLSAIVGIMTLLALAFLVDEKSKKGFVISLVIFSVCGTAFFVALEKLTETIYEVKINDISEYDFSKYKIIEQKGQIFVVKEVGKYD